LLTANKLSDGRSARYSLFVCFDVEGVCYTLLVATLYRTGGVAYKLTVAQLPKYLPFVVTNRIQKQSPLDVAVSKLDPPTPSYPIDATIHFNIIVKVKKKIKPIPVTGRGGVYGFEWLRSPHCLDS
jgi:hypothetical protein